MSKQEGQELQRVGLKITSPRIKILEIFEMAEEHHLSAEDIYRQLLAMGEDIGLATVYRVLAQFEQANLITRLNFESGHAVYELNQGEHHDHLVCVKCGKVAEFVDDVIEKRQLVITKKYNFEMTDHSLIIYGCCASCQ